MPGTVSVQKKGSSIPKTKSDEFLKILIKKRRDQLDSLVEELAKKNNPKLLSILKVENLFKKHIEFDSRTHLLRELKGSMKPTALNTVLARLVSENKIVVNGDHSLTWIDSEGNEKLNKAFENAVPL